MATPPSSRGSSLDHTFRPATPEPRTPLDRSASSMSVPKNEYLRNALESRRAQNSPLQSSSKLALIGTIPPRPAVPTPSARPQQLQTPTASPDACDEFDEFDLPDELAAPESPIRKRHPRLQDDTPPRGKTNQELSVEILKLREDIMTEKMRCELMRKYQVETHQKWLAAKEEVDRVQSLKEEIRDLEAENRRLEDTLEVHQQDMDEIDDMKDLIEKLQSERDAVEDRNKALVAQFDDFKQDTGAEIAGMEDALKEAVEIVHGLESEKSGFIKEIADLKHEKLRLAQEVQDVKARVAALDSQHVDGSSRSPQQPYVDTSIDEHRPATSYDDSDYYSQPATPRADVDRDAQSLRSVTSARSKQFFELTRERTQSARRLSKRLSDASLQAAGVFSAAHSPEILGIPEESGEVTPRGVDERFEERRFQRVGDDMHRPATVTPMQTQAPSGVGGLHRSDQRQRSGASRPSSSSHQFPRPHTRGNSAVELMPVPPPRMSSRHAHVVREDRLRPRPSDGTLESNTTSGTLVGTEGQKQEQVVTAWTLDVVDRERWWRDTEHMKPLRTRATTRTLRAEWSSDGGDSGLESFAVRAGDVRTAPSTPAAERPPEKEVFDPKESEGDFMRKTMMKLKGSIRRRHNESL